VVKESGLGGGAPHGLGRDMSRTEAVKHITLAEFQQDMVGVVSTSVKRGTIDESRRAYRDPANVIPLLQPYMRLVALCSVLLNAKARSPAELHRERAEARQ